MIEGYARRIYEMLGAEGLGALSSEVAFSSALSKSACGRYSDEDALALYALDEESLESFKLVGLAALSEPMRRADVHRIKQDVAAKMSKERYVAVKAANALCDQVVLAVEAYAYCRKTGEPAKRWLGAPELTFSFGRPAPLGIRIGEDGCNLAFIDSDGNVKSGEFRNRGRFGRGDLHLFLRDSYENMFKGGDMSSMPACIVAPAPCSLLGRTALESLAARAGFARVRIIGEEMALALALSYFTGVRGVAAIAVAREAYVSVSVFDSFCDGVVEERVRDMRSIGAGGYSSHADALGDLLDGVLGEADAAKVLPADVFLYGDRELVALLEQSASAWIRRGIEVRIEDSELEAECGAALQASVLAGDIEGVLAIPVLGRPIGITQGLGPCRIVEDSGKGDGSRLAKLQRDLGSCHEVLPRNVAYPVRGSLVLAAGKVDGRSIDFKVVEGAGEEARVLASCCIEGVKRTEEDRARAEVALDVDAEGRLSVLARDPGTRKRLEVHISERFDRPVPPFYGGCLRQLVSEGVPLPSEAQAAAGEQQGKPAGRIAGRARTSSGARCRPYRARNGRYGI